MRHDKSFISSILGALSTLVGEVVSFVLIKLGIGIHDIYSTDGIIITVNRYNFWYGILLDFLAGGMVAILLYYIVERLNSELIIFKAIMLSTFAWFGVEAFATAFFEGRYIDIRPLGDYGNHFISAFANGIILGLLFKWVLYRSDTRSEKN